MATFVPHDRDWFGFECLQMFKFKISNSQFQKEQPSDQTYGKANVSVLPLSLDPRLDLTLSYIGSISGNANAFILEFQNS